MRASFVWPTMHIMVHIKKKVVAVSVGDGVQPMKWLANVGMARYDEGQGRSLGVPVGVRLANGTLLSLTQTLSEAGLQDLQHVWVVFKKPKSGGKGGAASDGEEDD